MTRVGLGGDGAEPAGLVVLEGLDELGAGVHHERPVGGHRLADGLAAEDEHVELLVTALLVSAIGISTWLAAADYATIPPRGDFHERDAPAIVLTGAGFTVYWLTTTGWCAAGCG